MNSAGQSAGKKEVKGKEPMRIKYNLPVKKMGELKAQCILRMPADIAAFYGPPNDDDPLVILDVKDASETHCVRMMRECVHKNILHARVVMDKDPFLLVLVENYTGVLLTYLQSVDPYIGMFGKMSAYMIPTPELQLLVTHMLDGLFALWKYGKCHGNFSLANTCYLRTANDDILPKLTGFKYCKVSGTKPVLHYMAEDARSFGNGLSEISNIAKEFNKQGYSLDCFQIDDLAQRLKSVSPGDFFHSIKEIRTSPFFWTEDEGKVFFVSRVPLAMDSHHVRKDIKEAKDLCTLPWNNDCYDGFLQLMIKYRRRKNLPAYDFTDKVQYVQFISGIYTHEVELKHPSAGVHLTVKSVNPKLFVVLFSLLPPAPRPINQD